MRYLVALYLEQHQELLDFWTEYIDEDSNKLLLAVTAYLGSPWFDEGYIIYKTFKDTVIQSLCRILEIDQGKKKQVGDWTALKLFFCTKTEEIKSHAWKNNLEYCCAKKVVEVIECQLSKQPLMKMFQKKPKSYCRTHQWSIAVVRVILLS